MLTHIGQFTTWIKPSRFYVKSKYESYTYWNSTILKTILYDSDYYDYPIVKGTKYFTNEDAFYIKNVRSSTGDGKYSNGDRFI